MMKPLLVVIALGAGVGLLLPTQAEVAPAQSAAPATNPGTVSPTQPLTELRIDRRQDGHFYVDGLVNGQETHFLIDTGATHVALTIEDAREIGLKIDPEDFEPVVRGAGGLVRGQIVMLDRVAIGGRVVTNARATVLEGLEISLLGQSVLSQLGTLEMTSERLIVH
ncbi:MAG TPA: TIGR02281 family clan AA aspartic protease [Allosphingosinicella sp.]|jgi:aspartyl protease family protein